MREMGLTAIYPGPTMEQIKCLMGWRMGLVGIADLVEAYETMTRVAQEAERVFLPCERSHSDSYVCAGMYAVIVRKGAGAIMLFDELC